MLLRRSAVKSKEMEWNGMEGNGMEWKGMEWNGREWNGTTRKSLCVCDARSLRVDACPVVDCVNCLTVCLSVFLKQLSVLSFILHSFSLTPLLLELELEVIFFIFYLLIFFLL